MWNLQILGSLHISLHTKFLIVSAWALMLISEKVTSKSDFTGSKVEGKDAAWKRWNKDEILKNAVLIICHKHAKKKSLGWIKMKCYIALQGMYLFSGEGERDEWRKRPEGEKNNWRKENHIGSYYLKAFRLLYQDLYWKTSLSEFFMVHAHSFPVYDL